MPSFSGSYQRPVFSHTETRGPAARGFFSRTTTPQRKNATGSKIVDIGKR